MSDYSEVLKALSFHGEQECHDAADAIKALLLRLHPRTEALRAFVNAAKSWHNFHHGSRDIQCDALCECIPAGEEALKS